MEKNNIKFRNQEIKDRNIDELIGVSRGITADGRVNKEESEFLLNWIKLHFDSIDLNTYPINKIYDRLKLALEDDIIDENESLELKELLTAFTGDKPINEQISSMSSALPLCNPAPNIEFIDKSFCMTGAFTIGSRKVVENLIIELGGKIQKTPGLKTDFLVIGILGSDEWIHSSYGRKIERAVEIRDVNGKNIKIVTEEHLIKFI